LVAKNLPQFVALGKGSMQIDYFCAMSSINRLLTIMDELREQCPWDREQTWDSIRHLSIEEVYELSDAIMEKDADEVKKELGDVLLHIVFYAKIASETQLFNFDDVVDSICEKLIRRHPHIYSDVQAEDSETVKKNWEQIKLAEGKGEKTLLQGLPKSMPSIVKAYRMQEKVAQVGFDWDDMKDVRAKVMEELAEFENAGTQEEKMDEFGDLLFALVNYARHQGINPDDALEMTNRKFKRRFEYIEQTAKNNDWVLSEMGLEKMDKYWEEAKKVLS
jgi:XTP/dITP diphosphohydrolase